MERGHVIFGVLFILLPLLLVAGIVALPGSAYSLTLALVALLAMGFAYAIAFVDLD